MNPCKPVLSQSHLSTLPYLTLPYLEYPSEPASPRGSTTVPLALHYCKPFDSDYPHINIMTIAFNHTDLFGGAITVSLPVNFVDVR